MDIGRLKVGKGVEDLFDRHAVRDHPDDSGHRDPQITDARHATHLIRFNGDALNRHNRQASGGNSMAGAKR